LLLQKVSAQNRVCESDSLIRWRVRHAFVFRDTKDSDIIDVTIASLDDPTPFAPQKAIWLEDKLPWVRSTSRFRLSRRLRKPPALEKILPTLIFPVLIWTYEGTHKLIVQGELNTTIFLLISCTLSWSGDIWLRASRSPTTRCSNPGGYPAKISRGNGAAKELKRPQPDARPQLILVAALQHWCLSSKLDIR